MSRPKIYTPEEIRERKRLRSVEYRKRNREKIRAYKRSRREQHKAECRKWREKNPDYQRRFYEARPGYRHEYYAAHREAFREYHRKWREKHRDVRRILNRLSAEQTKFARRIRHLWRQMTDCEYYAHCRARNRRNKIRQYQRQGKNWGVGKPARRIPDYCCRGGYWT